MKIINNNNWGSREPLKSEDCTKLYLQIVRVWLDANADSPIDLALRSDNRTNLRELLFMIRKPGLILKLMYKDDGNIEKKLAGEEYESTVLLSPSSTIYRITTVLLKMACLTSQLYHATVS